jgi:uncharacterized protein involved in exopolysaccharide biosynthesis
MTDDRPLASTQSFNLLAVFWKQRRIIIWITLLGMVAGVAASYLITPRYTSEVVLFPTIANTPSKALLNEGASNLADLMAFGEDEDAQFLMQILHSDRIRETIAERFHLDSIYGIPPDSEHRRADLYEAYRDHVQVQNTKYNTVRVSVEDVDPVRAAGMANAIADEVDTVWADMLRQRTVKAYEMVKHQVEEEERVVATISDSLKALRHLGVHDYTTQSERFNQYLAQAVVKGDQRAVNEMERRLEDLATYGGSYKNLNEQLGVEVWRLGMWRTRMIQAEADMDSDIPHRFLMERAQPSDKKSSPIRWLVTLVSTLSAAILALLVVVVRENLHKFRSAHG